MSVYSRGARRLRGYGGCGAFPAGDRRRPRWLRRAEIDYPLGVSLSLWPSRRPQRLSDALFSPRSEGLDTLSSSDPSPSLPQASTAKILQAFREGRRFRMSLGKISLLAQPAHVIAAGGTDLALGVVEALKEWLETAKIFDTFPTRRRFRRHPKVRMRTFVGRQADRVKVIEFAGGSIVCYIAISEPNLYVCTIDVSSLAPAEAVIQAASALGAVELVSPTVTFRLEATYDEIVDVARLSCWAPRGARGALHGSDKFMEELGYYGEDGSSGSPVSETTSGSGVPRTEANLGLATVRWFADHKEPLAELALPHPRLHPMPDVLPQLS